MATRPHEDPACACKACAAFDKPNANSVPEWYFDGTSRLVACAPRVLTNEEATAVFEWMVDPSKPRPKIPGVIWKV